jgi:hypothetical protein
MMSWQAVSRVAVSEHSTALSLLCHAQAALQGSPSVWADRLRSVQGNSTRECIERFLVYCIISRIIRKVISPAPTIITTASLPFLAVEMLLLQRSTIWPQFFNGQSNSFLAVPS